MENSTKRNKVQYMREANSVYVHEIQYFNIVIVNNHKNNENVIGSLTNMLDISAPNNIFLDMLMHNYKQNLEHKKSQHIMEKRQILNHILMTGLNCNREKMFEQSLDSFEKALKLVESDPYPDEFQINLSQIKYAIALNNFQMNTYGSLCTARHQLLKLVNKETLFMYLTLGKVYIALYLYDECKALMQSTLKELESAQLVLFCWPYTTLMFEDSEPLRLKYNLKVLLTTCNAAPLPHAKCAYDNCVSMGHLQRKIYFNSPAFMGYVLLQCTDKCMISLHPNCWRKLKTNSSIYFDWQERACLTPSCRGLFASLKIFDQMLTLKTSKTFTTTKNELLEKKKNKQPNSSRNLNQKMEKNNIESTVKDPEIYNKENAETKQSIAIQTHTKLKNKSIQTVKCIHNTCVNVSVQTSGSLLPSTTATNTVEADKKFNSFQTRIKELEAMNIELVVKEQEQKELVLKYKNLLLTQLDYGRSVYCHFINLYKEKCQREISELQDLELVVNQESFPNLLEVTNSQDCWMEALLNSTNCLSYAQDYFETMILKISNDDFILPVRPQTEIASEPISLSKHYFTSVSRMNSKLENKLKKFEEKYDLLVQMVVGDRRTARENNDRSSRSGMDHMTSPTASTSKTSHVVIYQEPCAKEGLNNDGDSCSGISLMTSSSTSTSTTAEPNCAELPFFCPNSINNEPEAACASPSGSLTFLTSNQAAVENNQPRDGRIKDDYVVTQSKRGNLPQIVINALVKSYPYNSREEIYEALLDLRKKQGKLTGWSVGRIKAAIGPQLYPSHSVSASNDGSYGYDSWWDCKETDVCSICFESLEQPNIHKLKCNHIFHKDCIGMWLRTNSVCPMCRVYIILESDYPALT